MEMTTEQIIKALELCINNSILEEKCEHCPYISKGLYCMDEMIKDTIALIKEQQAEIERLSNNISAMATTLSTSARATRHEAYKEFAERFKQHQRNHYKNDLFRVRVIDILVDNLLNELVGDSK